jgi:hypothetical protein
MMENFEYGIAFTIDAELSKADQESITKAFELIMRHFVPNLDTALLVSGMPRAFEDRNSYGFYIRMPIDG